MANTPMKTLTIDDQTFDIVDETARNNASDALLRVENLNNASISKIEQTTTSTQDGGTNILTITKNDGTKSTFQVRNGSKGSNGTSANHSWNGTTLTVTSASGTSSANLKGDKGDKGDAGNAGVGIKSVAKTSSSGLVDIYTITLTDDSKYTFTVTNGKDGSGGSGDSTGGSTGGTGADGFSPVANITQTDSGAIITITDKSGTTVATINHGQNGSKGDKGDVGNPGYTPVRGTDYWTANDIAEIKSYVDDAILGGAW